MALAARPVTLVVGRRWLLLVEIAGTLFVRAQTSTKSLARSASKEGKWGNKKHTVQKSLFSSSSRCFNSEVIYCGDAVRMAKYINWAIFCCSFSSLLTPLRVRPAVFPVQRQYTLNSKTKKNTHWDCPRWISAAKWKPFSVRRKNCCLASALS